MCLFCIQVEYAQNSSSIRMFVFLLSKMMVLALISSILACTMLKWFVSEIKKKKNLGFPFTQIIQKQVSFQQFVRCYHLVYFNHQAIKNNRNIGFQLLFFRNIYASHYFHPKHNNVHQRSTRILVLDVDKHSKNINKYRMNLRLLQYLPSDLEVRISIR